VGEGVGVRGVTPEKQWAAIAREARRFSNDWIVQRRFETPPLATPVGPRFVCLGVFTVDGSAAGVYGRLASRPLIDERACDVAVLVGKPGFTGQDPSSRSDVLASEFQRSGRTLEDGAMRRGA
jgi:hypothetical protein